MEVKRNVIREAFLLDAYQFLRTPDQPNSYMTATETLQRAKEKGALVSPIVGRIQSELLCPVIERELDACMEAGVLPPMPNMLREAMEVGEYNIRFESDVTRMMKAGEGVGIDMMIQQAVQLANMGQQDVLDILDGQKIMERIQEIGGAPEDVVRSAEEVQAIQTQRAQAEMQQAQTEQMPAMASATKDLAMAEQIQSEIGAI